MSSKERKKFIVAKNTADFRELFETHYPQVFKRLTYMLADAAAAEDIAQEVFVKLLHSPPKEQTNLSGWLNKVAVNMALNYLRSEKHRRLRETKSEAQTNISSVEDDVFRIAQIYEVRDVLEKLAHRERLCLLLKASGSSYKEISTIIGVKKSSVGSILVRAQAKFKEAYGSQAQGGVENVLQPKRTSSLS